MARSKAPVNSQAATPRLVELLSSGTPVEEAMAIIKKEEEATLSSVTVKLSVSQGKISKDGFYRAISTLAGVSGTVSFAGTSHFLNDKALKAMGANFPVQLTFSDAAFQALTEWRGQVAGRVHNVRVAADSVSMSLGLPVLVDGVAQEDEAGNVITQKQLQVSVDRIIEVSDSPLTGMALPIEEDDFLAVLAEAGKLSQQTLENKQAAKALVTNSIATASANDAVSVVTA